MLVEPSTFKFLYQPEEGQAQAVEQGHEVEQEQEFAQGVEEQGRGRGVRTRGASNNERPRPSSPNSDSDPPPNNDQPEANNNLSNANNDPPNAGSSDESGEDPWKNDPPSIKDFPFNEQTGISIDVPEGAKPMFFFNLLMTDNLVDDLVAKTNQWGHSIIMSR